MQIKDKFQQRNTSNYSATMSANAILNTGMFTKIVHPDFFGEDGCWSPHRSDLDNP